MNPKLTILIPSIPERFERLQTLVNKLEGQIIDNQAVEIVVLIDNKSRTIGEKREALKTLVRGDYFAMVDDDDDVSEQYVSELLKAIEFELTTDLTGSPADVISFDSLADIEGKTGQINMSIENEGNEQFQPDGVTKRQPWHVCAWLSSKFKFISFGGNMYGEDYTFVEGANAIAETEHRIDKILHYYYYRSDVTQAFERENKQQ